MTEHDIAAIDPGLLEHLPVGLLLLDAQGRVAWLNEAMTELGGASPAAALGRSVAELPDAARLLIESASRLVQLGNTRWVQRALHAGGDGSRLLVALDVTAHEQLAEENARLRQQVEDLRLTDDLTGMPNKRAISQALDLHVSRSRRYQNPLSVVLAHVDLGTAAQAADRGDATVLAVSRFLRDRLRWVDQIARWEDNIFLLVLPETAETDARSLLDKIRGEQDSMRLPDATERPALSFGLACWKKGDDVRTLLRHALDDLRDNSGD